MLELCYNWLLTCIMSEGSFSGPSIFSRRLSTARVSTCVGAALLASPVSRASNAACSMSGRLNTSGRAPIAALFFLEARDAGWKNKVVPRAQRQSGHGDLQLPIAKYFSHDQLLCPFGHRPAAYLQVALPLLCNGPVQPKVCLGDIGQVGQARCPRNRCATCEQQIPLHSQT